MLIKCERHERIQVLADTSVGYVRTVSMTWRMRWTNILAFSLSNWGRPASQ